MPHEGYADPITNDGPRFHLDILVSELTKHDIQAIEASGVSSTPPVAETADRVMITKMSRPLTRPPLRMGLEESWAHKETECTIAKRQTPKGVKIREGPFPTHQTSRLYPRVLRSR